MLRKHLDKHSLERDGLLTQRELERLANEVYWRTIMVYFPYLHNLELSQIQILTQNVF